MRTPRCDLTTLSRLVHQWATLLESGMGIVAALRTLSLQQSHPALQQALPAICNKVEQGHRLHRCLGDFPNIFGQQVISLVKAGEESGEMDALLQRLAAWLEQDSQVRRRLQQALVYPITVVSLAIVLGWLLFTFFLPPFFAAFAESGTPLPWLTRVVVGFTHFVGHPLTWLLGLSALWWGSLASQQWWRLRKRRARVIGWIRRWPGIGRSLQLTATVRFSNCLALLLDCGLPLTRSWTLAAAASGDPCLEEDAVRVVHRVEQGQTLASILNKQELYPKGFSSLIRGAEESGSLPSTLSSLARLYDQEAQCLLDALSDLFEPLFIVGLAAGVIVILLAVMLPLYANLQQFGA